MHLQDVDETEFSLFFVVVVIMYEKLVELCHITADFLVLFLIEESIGISQKIADCLLMLNEGNCITASFTPQLSKLQTNGYLTPVSGTPHLKRETDSKAGNTRKLYNTYVKVKKKKQ